MKKHLLWVAIMVVFALILPPTGQAATVLVNATADNQFYMYLNTNPGVAGTQILDGNNWGSTYTAIAAPLANAPTQYLQVYGINWDGPASFIGDFTLSDANFHFANGTQKLLTNATDWFVSATGFNDGTNVATSYFTNGGGPWGFHSAIDADAQWIWTSDYTGTYAYLTAPIYSSAVPLPGAAWLLGSGLLGLAGWRRLKKA